MDAKHTAWRHDQYGIRDDGGYIVAIHWPHRYDGQEVRYEHEMAERRAHVALLAAAPETAAERDRLRAVNAELVAALQAIQQWSWGLTRELREDDVWKIVDAEITKAMQSKPWQPHLDDPDPGYRS